MKAFFCGVHPCPECFGNVSWMAKKCPHCGHQPSLNDRFNWTPEWVQMLFLTVMTSVFSLAGCFFLECVGVF